MTPLALFKCLADETRLLCLLLIQQEGELCVCELTTALNEIQPKVSRHLAQLRKIGLLLDRRQGQWVYYRLNPELPNWIIQVLAETAKVSGKFLEPCLLNLNRMGDRPVRVQTCC